MTLARENVIDHRDQCVLCLLRILFPEQSSQEGDHGLLDCLLDESKFLITLTAEDLAEKSNVVIFFLVLFDASDDRSGPLNDQVLQPVPLVQISVHELFHGLARQAVLLTLLIKLSLLLVDVVD